MSFRIIAVLAGTHEQYTSYIRTRRAESNLGFFYASTPVVVQGRKLTEHVVVGTFWRKPEASLIYKLVHSQLARNKSKKAIEEIEAEKQAKATKLAEWREEQARAFARGVIEAHEREKAGRHPAQVGVNETDTTMYALRSVRASSTYVGGFGPAGFRHTNIHGAAKFMDIPSLLQFVSTREDPTGRSPKCGRYDIVKLHKGQWEVLGTL